MSLYWPSHYYGLSGLILRCTSISIISPTNCGWEDHMESFKEVGARPWHLGIGVQSLAHTTGNEQKEWDDNESSISEKH